jgi:hypothetical protein
VAVAAALELPRDASAVVLRPRTDCQSRSALFVTEVNVSASSRFNLSEPHQVGGSRGWRFVASLSGKEHRLFPLAPFDDLCPVRALL